jgi:hypothetical protein
MTKAVMNLALAWAVALPLAQAAGVKVTEQQVNDVCGNGLQENKGAGVKGCTKKCGLNGEHTCDFSCIRKKCEGVCVSCGVKERRVTYVNRAAAARANAVITRAIERKSRTGVGS